MTKHRHFILHKPYGFLSQFKLERQNSKRLLGELYDFPDGIMAIGRLDESSEGLILLTTDGKISAMINSSKVEKEYYTQLDGDVGDDTISKLEAGVAISYNSTIYTTMPCYVKKLIPAPDFPERSRRIRDDRHGPTSWASIILREGKFRQVRKMTAVVGFPTLRLVRVRIGNIHLGSLQSGEVLEVGVFDV